VARAASHGAAGWALAVAAAGMIAVSCASAASHIVETRDLPEAGGAPRITAIDDLGGGDVPVTGELRALGRGDGVAVVGEVLWIHGTSFGRQPTVLVGSRPAAVLSRTADGGILVRVPVAAPAGPQTVAVIQERGRADASVAIRRYAGFLAPGSGRVVWLQLGAGSAREVGETGVPDARFLSLSADGRAAYVAGAHGPLAIVELPAPGRPAMVGRLDVGYDAIVALTAAATAPLLAVVRASDVLLVDTTMSLRPVRGAVRRLPAALAAARVRRVALSPDGRQLAFCLAEGNRVALVEIGRGPGEPAVAELALVPEARVPVLVDLTFAPDGQTLWVAAGDTAESHRLGPQPTRVFALRIRRTENGSPVLEAARSVAVPLAGDPTRLATGRALPLSSGAAVRLPPERATVYLAAGVRGSARSAVFSIGSEDKATELVAAPGASRVGAVDITPEGGWLLAATVVTDGAVSVLSAPADGQAAQTHTLTLSASSDGLPGGASELHIQP
jgi:hypothetical protein